MQRYDTGAERARDVAIKPSGKTDVTFESDAYVPNQNARNPLTIPSDRWTLPPRVIRLELNSAAAVSLTADTVTWTLNLPQLGPFKPGTVLVVRDISIFNLTHTVNSFQQFGLGGFTTDTVSTTPSLADNFEFGAIVRTASPAFFEFYGNAPLAVTLKQCEDGIVSQRVLLNRLTATGPAWVPGTTNIRLGLMLIEPGTNFL